nr:cytochrome c oxidase subunit II [Sphingomonas rubra]
MGRRVTGSVLPALLLAACNRHQSALAPFGAEAASTRTLTIVLLVAAVVIAASMTLLMRHAIRTPGERLTHDQGMKLVLWAGGVFPTILLFALLAASLPLMRPAPVSPADLRIKVEGEQFWWRVVTAPGPGQLVSANEVRLPVGRTVAIDLAGGDVIHSFWIPGLAGKMDMIPGRINTLVVRADKPGRYRGVCTEFCGLSHALMAFDVVAMEPAAFDGWMAGQRGASATASAAAPGAALFARYGCGGCHAIRGTDAASAIGPDLSRYGNRATLAAGILPMTTANTAAFIRHPEATKPGVRMPAFDHMPEADAVAIATYLQGLK